jgi:hypothetical protein
MPLLDSFAALTRGRWMAGSEADHGEGGVVLVPYSVRHMID